MKIDGQLKKKLKEQLIKSIQTEKRETVVVKSPFAFSESDIAQLKKTFKIPDSYRVENIVDSEVIGGFVIQHGSTIIDASVKTQINNLVARLQAAL